MEHTAKSAAAAGFTAVTIAAALLTSAGASAATASLSIKVKPRIVQYHHATKIEGALSSGKAGVPVALYAERFGQSSFSRVASQRTDRNGGYSFAKKPSLATHYRVRSLQSPATSKTKTVYVEPDFKNVSCKISGSGTTVNCRHGVALSPGTYQVSFSYDLLYPASTYATEHAKPVSTYFGERIASSSKEPPPPKHVNLYGTVSQTAAGTNTTHVSMSHQLTIPAGKGWSFFILGCTQTSEPTDGLGLPGAPGSHHCGASKLSHRQYTHWLG